MFPWISDTIAGMGYAGIVLLMFLENVFPPIPSELVMPAAGFTAARGELNFAGVVLAGTLGSLLGALPWYYAGRFLGDARLKRLASRHGRWLAVSSSEIETALRWFGHHGGKTVFAGRLIPTVRTLISVPAGVARMKLPAFLLCSAAGTLLWTGLLARAGFLLGDQYENIGSYLGPVSTVVVVLIVLAYVYRVVTFKRPA
ncbi:MAG: DedA family protein [Gammaproteobacteria bacterium]|nr:DedA family protein [Gammaproteobacteria bacterium]